MTSVFLRREGEPEDIAIETAARMARLDLAALDAHLHGLGGKLFVYPLLPSFFSFVLSLVASVVLNVTDASHCEHGDDAHVRQFVVGCIVLGYTLAAFYGFVLVGPEFHSLSLMAAGFSTIGLIIACFNIFGTSAIASASSLCDDKPIYKMALTLNVMYYLAMGVVLLPAVVMAIRAVVVACRSPKAQAPPTAADRSHSRSRADEDDEDDEDEDEAKQT